MSSPPSELPEPITPRAPQPPRGRDRALSSASTKVKKNALPPVVEAEPEPAPAQTPYEYASAELSATISPTSALPIAASTPIPANAQITEPHFARKHIAAWLVVIALLGIALAVTLPFTLGVYFGNRDREDFVERQAVEHYQRALAYESETYTELAIAELNAALQYKPDYQPALDHLNQLKTAQKPSAQTTPQDVSIAAQLYESAQQAVTAGSWNDAIDSFEELRRVKSDYRSDDVTTNLVRAYVESGRQALATQDVDLAGRRFEAALAIDPENADALAMHNRVDLYTKGTQAMGTDWSAAVLSLGELYSQDPTFGNVKDSLRDSHLGYGAFAEKQGAFCIAAREYNAALNLGASGDAEAQAATANDSCKQAILNPTPLPTATLGGGEFATPPAFTTPVPSIGAIVYSAVLSVRQNQKCNGTGSIKGAVQDGGGNPIPNVGVKIYNDYGYLPPYARTDIAGEYEMVLGTDKGVFHLVVIDEFGRNASEVTNVDYRGGNEQGCHIVLNWKRTQ